MRRAKNPERRRRYEHARYWAKHEEILAKRRAYWAANSVRINAVRNATRKVAR